MMNVIPFNKPPEPEKICSFWKSTEYAVKRLFSNNLEGANLKFICNKCVVKCKEICTNEETVI